MKAKGRRRVHLIVLLLWLGPGAVLSVLLRNSLVWIVFMSWYAIVVSHLAAYSAETPVEPEDA